MPGFRVIGAAIGTAVICATAGAGRPAAGQAGAAPDSHRQLLDRYCVTCHNDRLETGGLSLQRSDLTNVAADAAVWEKVVAKLRAGAMPPQPRPRPEPAAYDGFRTWLETELDRAAAAELRPGRTEALHRLSRAEYRNVVRDLLDLDVDVSDLLPADDTSYGFGQHRRGAGGSRRP